MAISSIYVTLYLVLTKEHKQPVILSNYCSELFAGSICVTLKDFGIVQIGQVRFFCESHLHVIECPLMDLVLVLGYLFWFRLL